MNDQINRQAACKTNFVAMASYREAVRYNPDDAVSRINLGILLTAQKEYGAALEQFDAALDRAPQEPPLHLQKGICLLLAERPEEARTSLSEALCRLTERLGPVFSTGRLSISRLNTASASDFILRRPTETVVRSQMSRTDEVLYSNCRRTRNCRHQVRDICVFLLSIVVHRGAFKATCALTALL